MDRGINAYLADGPNVLVKKATKPISPVVRPTSYGSKPAGNLTVEATEYEEVISDPVAAKYVRPYRGSRELLHSLDRWCFWLEDLDPADLSKSPLLKRRLEEVRNARLESDKVATQALAEVPHLFAERRQPQTPFLCIPSVVSETRRYFTAGRFGAEVVPSNLVFWAPDEDGLLFSLISSSMFITWQKTVGGRLESRLRFANTVTWNTFPVPELDETARRQIIKAGQGVLDARELHPERSLADHYNPLAMDPALLRAHDALDRVVDRAFGAPRKLTTERQRQELLFESYARMTYKK